MICHRIFIDPQISRFRIHVVLRRVSCVALRRYGGLAWSIDRAIGWGFRRYGSYDDGSSGAGGAVTCSEQLAANTANAANNTAATTRETLLLELMVRAFLCSCISVVGLL